MLALHESYSLCGLTTIKQKECSASVKSHWLVYLHRFLFFFLVTSDWVQQEPNEIHNFTSPQLDFKSAAFIQLVEITR